MPLLIVIAAAINVWMSLGLEETNAFYTPPAINLSIVAVVLVMPYLINLFLLTRRSVKAQFNAETHVTKKLLISLIISAVLVTLILGYLIGFFLDLGRPYIQISNYNQESLANVTIVVGGNVIELAEIPAEEVLFVDISEPFGESDVQISYDLKGERVEWRGGYVEGSGGYLADLIIESDGEINFISDRRDY